MFDRYEAGEQAVLVHIYFSQNKDTEDLREFEALVSSAGVEALQIVTGSRKAPHPKYFVGEGKAEEIADAVKASGASVVLFDHALSAAQERNLERLCQCRVIDRTGLILDIFAQRARTHEGKLQVELAQLRHIATRLVRGWTHLERQKGGIGDIPQEARQYRHNQAYAYSIQGDGAEDDDERIVRFHTRCLTALAI